MSPVDTADYYERLGVGRNASEDEIKQAFRKGARQWHPDVNKENDAEENFKMINEAYGVLSDQQKKRAYDSTLEDKIKFEAGRSNPVEGDAVSNHMRGNGWVARDDIWDTVIREAMNGGFGAMYEGGARTDEEMWNNLADAAFPGVREMFFGRGSQKKQNTDEGQTSARHRTRQTARSYEPPTDKSKELQISDNDLALVAALKEAYAINENRNWRIMRDSNDQRGYPAEIWRIEKRGQDIKILRVVDDWRQKKEGNGIAGKYVDVSNLANPKYRDELKLEGINVPWEFTEYMGNLRDLAKLTPTSAEMPFVIDEINSRSSRMGEYTKGIKPSREATLRFNIKDIDQQLKNREAQIVSVKRRMMTNEGGRHFDPGERRL